ncbi:Utp14 protein-domain-containing protein [Elsinoe ampelina]|uniref:Utp14 protein-domain-containing protein n=1 Tax=Elsinoe ampelina TaxID=302913 RepID=A0A6A6G440_9PEZI|nr:Utp14 protein-domain-containing protein [Elsinoe ampelina]
MPRRIARSNTTSATPAKSSRKKTQKSQKRALNAFTAAQHVVEDKAKFRSHRVGEIENTERGAKRRRAGSGDEEEEEEDEGRDAKRNKGDDSDHGSDSSGNEWRIGGEIGEDSDSDLDSDEAFGESDEERFEGFTFRGSSAMESGKKKKRRVAKKPPGGSDGEMDLDESEEEDEEQDDFGDEGVDLATMLDQPASSEEDEDEDSGSEADSESDAASDTSASSHGSSSAAKISKLQDLVASLEPKQTTKSQTADVHESLAPSDYALTSKQKLAISDLLPTVTDPALRKSLKSLTSTKPSKGTKLSAPLPARQQAKLDRSVALAKAKEELDKWQDTVIHNRRAEHLSFPLADPTKSAPVGENQLVGINEDTPANELEGAIRSILEESGLASAKKDEEEDRIRRGEELAMKEVPLDEVLARRAALRKARELLFREEIKAKRISKIKSKSYRRVHRKERERDEERRREIMGDDEGEDEREKRDRIRAMERMGGRHRESKWAKGMKKAGRTVWDDDAREGVVDMARRNEELRRRMEGKEGSDESESEEEADSDEGSEEERDRLGRQLSRLEEDDAESRKGLGNMAFMKRADAARKAQNEQTIRELRKDLDGGDGSEEEFDADTTVGRQIFGPKPTEAPRQKQKVVKNVLEEPESGDEEQDEDAEIITERGQPSRPQASKKASSQPLSNGHVGKAQKQVDATTTDDIDAWMTAKTGSGKDKKRAAAQEYIPSPAKAATPAVNGNTKLSSKQKPSLDKSTNTQLPAPSTLTTLPDPDSASDPETTDPILTPAQQQQLYHARAFAGDDVLPAFTTEKSLLAASEDEQETSTHLPGWGSWTGTGLSKSVRRQNAKQKHNPLFKTKVDGVRQADRKDAKLKNVIISERQERKGRKYLATQLPHEFERKEQYERSLRVPLGPEWVTKETFQRGTRPRVVVKQGVVGEIERPLL